MKVCYLDCFSGISGDMLLGALVDAGLSPDVLEAELRKLPLTGWKLNVRKVQRGALSATKLDFQIEEAHHHRTWKTIRTMLQESGLSDPVRRRALAIFERLAEAEATAHGVSIEDVHFHEVGAMDSILDIVGAAIAFEHLAIERVACSPLAVGSGTVETAHGRLPVPAPATATLLKGAPVYAGEIVSELVTPTGAAIVAVEASEFGQLPRLNVSAIGYGAGARDFKEQPNVLRIFLGESTDAFDATTDTITVLEANLDDMNPQVAGHFMEQALAAGALDVYYTPVQMKKNRPGIVLTILSPTDKAEPLSRLVFEQTTTLGLRMYETQRRVLKREHISVDTPHGAVRIKLARLNGRVLNAAPEYEDCRKLAEEKSVPLKTVLAEAEAAFRARGRDL